MKRVFVIVLAIVLVMGFMVNSVGAYSIFTPTDARATGGGQLRDEDWKISFSLGIYVIGGEKILEDTKIKFHNVSVPEVCKGVFKAEALTKYDSYVNDPNVDDGATATIYVTGTFNDEPGYRMIIRLQDNGEPARDDDVRFELFKVGTGSAIFDTHRDGFTDVSQYIGTARTDLDKGNIQVEAE